MSEHKQLVRRWFDEVWNGRDPNAPSRLLTANGVVHGLSQDGSDIHGPENFRKFQDAFLGAFSNLHLKIEDMIEEGDRVCTRFTATGLHDGPTLGFPATHKEMRVTGITITRMANGKLAEGWNVFDAMGMLGQLGAIPSANAW